jgi:hypothetical protein
LQQGSPCMDAGDDDLVPEDYGDVNDDSDEDETTPLDLDLLGRFVNTVDMGPFENPKVAQCFADLNDDCLVNGLDLGILLISWSIPPGSPGCGGSTPCEADLNGDGQVNGLDLGILLVNWSLTSRSCCESLMGGGEESSEEEQVLSVPDTGQIPFLSFSNINDLWAWYELIVASSQE